MNHHVCGNRQATWCAVCVAGRKRWEEEGFCEDIWHEGGIHCPLTYGVVVTGTEEGQAGRAGQWGRAGTESMAGYAVSLESSPLLLPPYTPSTPHLPLPQ